MKTVTVKMKVPLAGQINFGKRLILSAAEIELLRKSHALCEQIRERTEANEQYGAPARAELGLQELLDGIEHGIEVQE